MLKKVTMLAVILIIGAVQVLFSQAIIADHNCVDITAIPLSAINNAKANLHIAYGHTSHGSQVTTGMTGLVSFANGGGKGLSHPANTFAWNNGGSSGALDLHDYAMGGDVGYFPAWRDNTIAYLANAANSDVNVIIWSWCGQVDDKYSAGTLHSEYITPMTALEVSYPAVKFVYMTGHVDHWDDADNKAANQVIRDFCNTNGKILYDFSDIESYDPDGTYYEFPHDNCDYYSSASGNLLGNWATAWQGSHTEDVDWYDCGAAHSVSLNANQKAYAAWWLWAKLAGWDGSLAVQMSELSAESSSEGVEVLWAVESETDCSGFHIWRSDSNSENYERISAQLISGRGNSSERAEYTYLDTDVRSGEEYCYKIEEIASDGSTVFHGPIFIKYSAVIPRSVELDQNYPNPFNPETWIEFSLPGQADVNLSVYNLRGQLVKILEAGTHDAGTHRVKWDARDDNGLLVESGVYLYRLQTDECTVTGKMTYIK